MVTDIEDPRESGLKGKEMWEDRDMSGRKKATSDNMVSVAVKH